MVEYVEESVKLPKEAAELKDSLISLIKAVRKSLKDGFQPIDIPAILSTEFKMLIVGIDGVEKLPDDIKADLGAHLECSGLMVGQISKALVEKQ